MDLQHCTCYSLGIDLLSVIESLSGFFAEYGKPLRVLHFGFEDSKRNYNYFDNKSTLLLGEPLLATVVLYLSHRVQGGQILFPESEVREKPFY